MATILNPIKWESVSGAKASGAKANIRLHGVGTLMAGRRECYMMVGITSDGNWVASVKHNGNMPAVKAAGKFEGIEEAKRSILEIAQAIAPLVNEVTQGRDKPGVLTYIG